MDINSINLAVTTVMKKVRDGAVGVLPTRLEETTLNATYVRFVDLAGNPITARHVTIKVDTSTWEIADIVAEV